MDLSQIKKQALKEIEKIKNPDELRKFQLKYLSRKGTLTAILRSLKNLSINQRKETGLQANKLKNELVKAIDKKKKKIEKYLSVKTSANIENYDIDVTAPGIKMLNGHLHPLTQLLREISAIFRSMGFEIVEGPDIETEYYNFDALNIPKEHPARDAWDTFWLKTKPNKLLLRTHTSPMQVRYMEKNNPPFRIIVPGKVFRYESTDASHSHTFYQIEGLVINKEVSVANFKSVIYDLLKQLFSDDIKIRLRPGYFPFTEPSFEVDLKGGRAYQQTGKLSNWLEIMGAGMVHPNVLKAVGYNPKNWQGFAFGIGLDRIAMIKHEIDDIRLFYNNDLRFLNQF